MVMPIKKYTNIAIVSGLAFSAFSLLSGMTCIESANRAVDPKTQSSEQALPVVQGELAKYYETVDELAADSQIIVLGKFQGNPNVIRPNISQDSASSKSENEAPPQRHLDTRLKLLAQRDPGGRRELAFQPIEILKGGIQVSSITVAQRAAISENIVRAFEDDTLFEPGETYVLFLTPALPHEGNFYWITGAIQVHLK